MLKSTILAVGCTLMIPLLGGNFDIHPVTARANAISTSMEDTEISEYIEGKTEKGQGYYLYDLLVNKADMSSVQHDVISIGVSDEAVEDAIESSVSYKLVYDEAMTEMPEDNTYTLRAGRFYIMVGSVDGYCYNDISDSVVQETGIYSNMATYPAAAAKWIENTQDTIQYLTNVGLYNVPSYYYNSTCDGTCLYEDETNDITIRISENWNKRLQEIGLLDLKYETLRGKELSLLDSDEAVFIVPYEDTNLTFDTKKLEAKKGFTLNIYSFNVDGIADMKKPDFNLNNYYFVVDVNNPLSLDTIFDLIKLEAWDETDGNLTRQIQVDSTTYDADNIKVGIHEVNLSVTDKSGNRSEATFYIQVLDNDSPEFSGILEYRVSYNNPIEESSIRQNLFVSDNYDTDLTLELISNTYTPNQNKVGNYQLIYLVKDSSDNQTEIVVNVEVYDDTAPIIVAPQRIETSTAICLTSEDILTKIQVYDEHDGDLIPTIEDLDDYKKNYSIVGEYRLKIIASDSSGNTQSFIITIQTKDDVAPNFWMNMNYIIVIEQGTTLSDEQILLFLVKTNQIKQEEVITLNHQINYSKAGIYPVKAELKNGTIKTFYVAVTEKEETQQNNYLWLIPVVAVTGMLTVGIVLIMKKRKNRKEQ